MLMDFENCVLRMTFASKCFERCLGQMAIVRGKQNNIIRFKKAFDTVDHGIRLVKLHHYDINGIEHYWFCSSVNNRKQLCRVNGEYSKFRLLKLESHRAYVLGLSFSCFTSTIYLLHKVKPMPICMLMVLPSVAHRVRGKENSLNNVRWWEAV